MLVHTHRLGDLHVFGEALSVITSRYGKDAFEFRENSIVVRVPFRWVNTMQDTGTGQQGNPKTEVRLSETQRKMLAEIRNNPNVTKRQLQSLLGVGKTTVDNGIAALKRAGLIQRVGSNKSGYWEASG